MQFKEMGKSGIATNSARLGHRKVSNLYFAPNFKAIKIRYNEGLDERRSNATNKNALRNF
jgi:hypothetical protein